MSHNPNPGKWEGRKQPWISEMSIPKTWFWAWTICIPGFVSDSHGLVVSQNRGSSFWMYFFGTPPGFCYDSHGFSFFLDVLFFFGGETTRKQTPSPPRTAFDFRSARGKREALRRRSRTGRSRRSPSRPWARRWISSRPRRPSAFDRTCRVDPARWLEVSSDKKWTPSNWCPTSHLFQLFGEDSPSEIDVLKKVGYHYSKLSTGGPSQSGPSLGLFLEVDRRTPAVFRCGRLGADLSAVWGLGQAVASAWPALGAEGALDLNLFGFSELAVGQIPGNPR